MNGPCFANLQLLFKLCDTNFADKYSARKTNDQRSFDYASDACSLFAAKFEEVLLVAVLCTMANLFPFAGKVK